MIAKKEEKFFFLSKDQTVTINFIYKVLPTPKHSGGAIMGKSYRQMIEFCAGKKLFLTWEGTVKIYDSCKKTYKKKSKGFSSGLSDFQDEEEYKNLLPVRGSTNKKSLVEHSWLSSLKSKSNTSEDDPHYQRSRPITIRGLKDDIIIKMFYVDGTVKGVLRNSRERFCIFYTRTFWGETRLYCSPFDAKEMNFSCFLSNVKFINNTSEIGRSFFCQDGKYVFELNANRLYYRKLGIIFRKQSSNINVKIIEKEEDRYRLYYSGSDDYIFSCPFKNVPMPIFLKNTPPYFEAFEIRTLPLAFDLLSRTYQFLPNVDLRSLLKALDINNSLLSKETIKLFAETYNALDDNDYSLAKAKLRSLANILGKSTKEKNALHGAIAQLQKLTDASEIKVQKPSNIFSNLWQAGWRDESSYQTPWDNRNRTARELIGRAMVNNQRKIQNILPNVPSSMPFYKTTLLLRETDYYSRVKVQYHKNSLYYINHSDSALMRKPIASDGQPARIDETGAFDRFRLYQDYAFWFCSCDDNRGFRNYKHKLCLKIYDLDRQVQYGEGIDLCEDFYLAFSPDRAIVLSRSSPEQNDMEIIIIDFMKPTYKRLPFNPKVRGVFEGIGIIGHHMVGVVARQDRRSRDMRERVSKDAYRYFLQVFDIRKKFKEVKEILLGSARELGHCIGEGVVVYGKYCCVGFNKKIFVYTRSTVSEVNVLDPNVNDIYDFKVVGDTIYYVCGTAIGGGMSNKREVTLIVRHLRSGRKRKIAFEAVVGHAPDGQLGTQSSCAYHIISVEPNFIIFSQNDNSVIKVDF